MSDRVLVSASEEAFMLAVRELQDALGPVSVERLGPELGLMTADGLTIEEVAAHCESDPLVFVRHLATEVDRVRSHVGVAAARAIHYAELPDIGPEIAVQAWASGMPTIGFGAAEAAQEIVAALRDEGFQPVRAGAAYTLSCALVGSDAILGLNRRDAALCDWPGGKVRLGRTKEQVSRAEFKLEELFDIFGLRVPDGGKALDLGAAPGGWTRILRQHGLTVWAVDPGDLDPSLADDRSIHHSRTTAGEFLRSTRVRFDVVVNDMRMEPKLSCRMMIDAAARLNPGGLGVVTLKTGSRHVLETVRSCLQMLAGTFEIVHARQLHHNRHEVTVVVRRR